MLTGTLYPELYRPWRPRARAMALFVTAAIGISISIHATVAPDAHWYMVDSESISGLYQLAGIMLVCTAAIGAIPALIMPWQARRAAQSPLILTVGRNILIATGRGRHEDIHAVAEMVDDNRFSSDYHMIDNPRNLASALDRVFENISIRIKPFVVIRFAEGEAPTPAERAVIQEVVGTHPNVLDFSQENRG